MREANGTLGTMAAFEKSKIKAVPRLPGQSNNVKVMPRNQPPPNNVGSPVFAPPLSPNNIKSWEAPGTLDNKLETVPSKMPPFELGESTPRGSPPSKGMLPQSAPPSRGPPPPRGNYDNTMRQMKAMNRAVTIRRKAASRRRASLQNQGGKESGRQVHL